MDYFHITLRLFQQILVVMMCVCNFVCYIASRGQGKSFLTAIVCCVRCILYPGTKIIIAAGTKGQGITILEKIKIDLIPR